MNNRPSKFDPHLDAFEPKAHVSSDTNCDESFNQHIIQLLNQQAKQRDITPMMAQVMQEIGERTHHRKHNRIGLGLALAAAISGMSVLPQFITAQQAAPSAAALKMSPQLADDLDMLSVLGEDGVRGS